MKKFLGIGARELGETLKKNRRRSKLTQKNVADVLGIDRSTYARYEMGRKPTVDSLIRLAAVFGMTLEELLAPFFADERDATTPISVVSAPRLPAATQEDLGSLSEDEIKLVLIYRNSLRKNVIMENAVGTLDLDGEMTLD